MGQKGFSLIEVMVATGILGGVGLGTMALMKKSQESQKALEVREEGFQVFSHITHVLIDKANCETSLKGKKIGDSLAVKMVVGGEEKTLYEVGGIYQKNTIKVENLRLIEDDGYFLQVAFLKKKDNAFSDRLPPKNIPLSLQVFNDTVETCLTKEYNTVIESARAVCVALGGSYNPNNNKCNKISLDVDAHRFCQDGECSNIGPYIVNVISARNLELAQKYSTLASEIKVLEERIAALETNKLQSDCAGKLGTRGTCFDNGTYACNPGYGGTHCGQCLPNRGPGFPDCSKTKHAVRVKERHILKNALYPHQCWDEFCRDEYGPDWKVRNCYGEWEDPGRLGGSDADKCHLRSAGKYCVFCGKEYDDVSWKD